MHLKKHHAAFLAFTALFAVLAGFVFWGAWALDLVPVMPDAATSFPVEYIRDWLNGWKESGKFIPGDLVMFILDPYAWVELRYAVCAYLSALGLAYYLRGRGLSLVACYGAGLLLGFCGYWFSLFSAGHLGWFRWMAYGVFAFGLADRAVRKNKLKNWILLGAVVGWAGFYQPDLWLFFTVFTFFYLVWCAFRERYMPSWKGLAIGALTFLVISAPSIRGAALDKENRDIGIKNDKEAGSALTGGSELDDKESRWVFVTNWSLPPNETIEFIWPRVNGDTSCQLVLGLGYKQKTGVRPYTGALGRTINSDVGNYRQHSLYVGLITCIFALLGVCLWPVFSKGKARVEVYFFFAAAILFYLLSLGRYFAPLYRLVFALPIADSIRCPVKWHHLTEFSVVVLAGFGIEATRRALCKFAKLKDFAADIILAAVVVAGAWDLARIDRLFLAVHARDTEITQLPQRFPPREEMNLARLKASLEKQGLKEVGALCSQQICPVPKPKEEKFYKKQIAEDKYKIAGTQNIDMGDGKKAPCWILESTYRDRMLVEYKVPRPALRTVEKPMSKGALVFASLSAFATILVLVYLIAGMISPKVSQISLSGAKSK
ncbi:MAG: hypothetical protein IJQ34_08675 [Kiritimatiellae bacterium]|nr:hypothetical protein [Kiritimatiellia bacterium]